MSGHRTRSLLRCWVTSVAGCLQLWFTVSLVVSLKWVPMLPWDFTLEFVALFAKVSWTEFLLRALTSLSKSLYLSWMAHKGAYLSLHEMKQPAVLLLPLGEGFFKHLFTLLHRERCCESDVSYQRTQQNDLAQLRTQTLRPGVNH